MIERSETEALITFVESLDKEITPPPPHESEAQRRLRLLDDALTRFHFHEEAGLSDADDAGYWAAWDFTEDMFIAAKEQSRRCRGGK